MIDLGLNRGCFATEMIERYAVHVYGLEPDPGLFKALPAHPRLSARQAAVAAHRGYADLHTGGSACSTITDEVVDDQHGRVRVPTLPLADFLREAGVGEVDLIKVDVEGAEIDVLLSLTPELAERIQQVTVEFHVFIAPAMAPQAAVADRHMETLGFERIDMSRVATDVLYINRAALRLCWVSRMVTIGRYKYLRGARRSLLRYRKDLPLAVS